jgi:hypothetical protein
MMAFALTPDGKPPRLIRFSSLEEPYIAVYKTDDNLLWVDRTKYNTLTPSQQEKVLRTHTSLLLINGTMSNHH